MVVDHLVGLIERLCELTVSEHPPKSCVHLKGRAVGANLNPDFRGLIGRQLDHIGNGDAQDMRPLDALSLQQRKNAPQGLRELLFQRRDFSDNTEATEGKPVFRLHNLQQGEHTLLDVLDR